MRILITGAFGQDAQWLAQLMLEMEAEVWVTDRRRSRQGVYPYKVAGLLEMDLLDPESIRHVLLDVKPDAIFHMAAQSHVGWSFKIPEVTLMTNAMGTFHILETIRRYLPKTRMYFAGSSEQFGGVPQKKLVYRCKKHNCGIEEASNGLMICPTSDVDNDCSSADWIGEEIAIPQDENTPFNPRSPYAISKVTGFQLVKNYREAYNLKVCSGICYNHESSLRGDEFLPKKVCNYVKRLKEALLIGDLAQTNMAGALERVGGSLKIGNIFAKRDWSWAKECCEGMWRILYQDGFRIDQELPCATNLANTYPDCPHEWHGWEYMPGKDFKDYVLGTGKTISVAQFVKRAFELAGFKGSWRYSDAERTYYPLEEDLSRYEQHYDWKFAVRSSSGEYINVVEIDPKFYRPSECHELVADASMAEQELGWKASENSLDLIIKDMLNG